MQCSLFTAFKFQLAFISMLFLQSTLYFDGYILVTNRLYNKKPNCR